MTTIEELERRIEKLEETENVKRAMARIGRWMDRCELTKDRADFEFLANELMTADGFIVTMFGNWGPDKTQLIEDFSKFAGDISWAVHQYLHQEVDLDLEAGTAHFHALEMVPIQWKEGPTWLLLENDSDLQHIDGQWKLHRYGVEEPKALGNTATAWAEIAQNPKAWMFSHP
ncbi:MAG: hypothetical protein ACI915_001288 [Gammaproteobacteria bacterium]|jgi:hypothetical protein